MFLRWLLLICLVSLTACSRSIVSWLSAPPPSGSKPVKEKPKPGDENYVRLIWTFKDSRAENADMSDMETCDASFVLDEDCAQLNKKCHRNHNIYACQPEDGIMLFQGQVLDEEGHGIAGADVHLGIPASGYTDMVRTITKEDGRFLIRTSGVCYNWGYARKDGYVDSTGYEYARVIFKCSFENWGVPDIKIRMFLKKTN